MRLSYYDLKENPCHKAGSMGKKEADEMEIWTHEEFKYFISAFEDRPQSRLAFEMLYFTGLRIGELMALTPVDIDLKEKTVSVTKSLQRRNKADVITAPKTPKSLRIISLPNFLCNDLAAYMGKIYGGQGIMSGFLTLISGFLNVNLNAVVSLQVSKKFVFMTLVTHMSRPRQKNILFTKKYLYLSHLQVQQ